MEGGTCLPVKELPSLLALSRKVVRDYIAQAAEDDRLIAALSTKYHAPYRALARQCREMGAEVFERDVVTDEAMMLHGRFLEATKDALVDLQTIPGTVPPAGAQVTVLGVPFAYFDAFFPPALVSRLHDLGVYVKSQPNSVVIARKGIDKATLVNWLIEHGHHYHPDGFALERAIAFGDCPDSIDKPLTTFPSMPFVSAAPNESKTPQMAHVVHVGDEEVGTGRFLTNLLADVKGGACSLHDTSMLQAVVHHIAQRSVAKRHCE